jgi:hypothetical protein
MIMHQGAGGLSEVVRTSGNLGRGGGRVRMGHT